MNGLSYDDLILLAHILKSSLEETLKNVQFLHVNYPDSDLISHYESQYDAIQALYLKAQDAAVSISIQNKIKQN